MQQRRGFVNPILRGGTTAGDPSLVLRDYVWRVDEEVHEAGALGTGGTFFEEFGCFGHLRTTDSIGGDGDGAGRF